MFCKCTDWQENISKVNAPLMLQAARSGFDPSVGYDGKRFVFCPWCSNPLGDEASDPKGAASVELPNEAGALPVTPNPAVSSSAGVIEQEWRVTLREDKSAHEIVSGNVHVAWVTQREGDKICDAFKSSVAALRERIKQLEAINQPVTGEPNCD